MTDLGADVLYLAQLGDHDLDPAVEGPWRELRTLRPGLIAIDSDHHRSAVYHALKDHLPGHCALLVTELHEIPKFKGMTAGSLAWFRARA